MSHGFNEKHEAEHPTEGDEEEEVLDFFDLNETPETRWIRE